MKKLRIFSLITVLLLVNQCANQRSHTGATLGAVTSTAACLQYTDNPVITAACAVSGAWIGAELMYNSDYDVHNAVFVDHMNKSPGSAAYTNWYNQSTGNSGIIKTTRSWTEGPLKCKDYETTVDITNQWPLIGIGGINRRVNFGVACQMPDGRWIEKQ
jgi:surface antigen